MTLDDGSMSDIAPGEWFKLPEWGKLRVIGPWPDDPDHWVVASCNTKGTKLHRGGISVVTGRYLVDLRELRPETWRALARDKKAAEQQGWLPGQIAAFGIPVEVDESLPLGRYEIRVRRRL